MSTFGIVLMLVGVALAAAEAHVPSHGALGRAAAVAVAAGIGWWWRVRGSERPSR